jgi:hypothetical protein
MEKKRKSKRKRGWESNLYSPVVAKSVELQEGASIRFVTQHLRKSQVRLWTWGTVFRRNRH